MNIFHVSLKNLRHRPVRTASLLLGMAALAGMLFALSSVYVSVNRSIERSRTRLGADAMVVPSGQGQGAGGILLSGRSAALRMDAGVKERIEAMEDVEATSSQLFIVSAPLACCSISDVLLVGFEPEKDFTVTPWLREKLGKPLPDDGIIIGSGILSEPGGRIRFYGDVFLVMGKLDATGMEFIDRTVFIPMPAARRMIAASPENAEAALDIKPNDISAVMIKFKEGVDQGEAAVRMEFALPGHTVVLASEALRNARQGLLVPLKSMAMAGVLQWVVSLTLMGVLFGVTVEERKREIGLMRAMGARQGHVRRTFLVEVLLLSSGGAAAGIAAGGLSMLGFSEVLSSFFDIPFIFPEASETIALALGTFLFTVASGLFATMIPIRRAQAEPPHHAVAG